MTSGLRPVQPTPAGVIRSVGDRLDQLERDLAAARSAFAQAETELLTALHRSTLEPVALTTGQVGELLGLSQSTVGSMISRGELVSVKLGGSRRVLRRDLDAYLATVAGGAA